MNYRDLVTISHVASQIIYRWIPPPTSPEQATGAQSPQSSPASSNDWADLINSEANSAASRLSWLPRYLRSQDRLGMGLAQAINAHLAAIESAHARYVVWGDKEYPSLLRNISDPPLGLSIRGELSLLYRPAISVVGSRKASAFAMRESFALGRALGERDIAVVSGGALGCDIAAHHGVLASGRDPAPAICVFAGGLARLYPVANDPIFRRLMARRAVLVSERLWASPCRPMDFTARNRIISGMSSLTLVMQAAQRSGALVTARRALDQGSEVAVLRHPEGDIRARGSEALLADGAWGFSCASELIEHANLLEASLASRTDSALQ